MKNEKWFLPETNVFYTEPHKNNNKTNINSNIFPILTWGLYAQKAFQEFLPEEIGQAHKNESFQ